MANYDISGQNGRSLVLTIIANDASGNPIDLTNYVASGGAKLKYSDTGYFLDLAPQITAPSSGIININIPASGVQNLPITQARYSINITLADDTQTILEGYLVISPEV